MEGKIYFIDGRIIETNENQSVEEEIVRNIEHADSCEVITEDIECYELEERESEFVKCHKDCTFFMANSDAGGWNQPLEIVAFEF